jgi:hypothetical protein
LGRVLPRLKSATIIVCCPRVHPDPRNARAR